MSVRRLVGCVLLGGLLLPGAAWSQAFPINSDVALQPAEGQWLYRTQGRFRRTTIRATAPDTDVDVLVNRHVLVYGWSSRVSTVLAVPVVYRDVDGPGTDDEDAGVGDIRAIVRYQPWKRQGYLASQSLTVLAGLEVPTFDEPFSSRSWDPIIGTVYTWRKDKYGFDADVVYQINTENDRDFEAGDTLKYDLAFQRRLWPAAFTADTRRTLTGLLELNGEAQWEAERNGRRIDGTDAHQVFIGPGLVLGGRRGWVELGAQVPVFRDVGSRAPADDWRIVLGVAWTF